MSKTEIIYTQCAPKAIGPYSQAIRTGNVTYFSGQISLDPKTMNVVSDKVVEQAKQVFENLKAVAEAANGRLGSIVKLTIYLTNLAEFALVNEVMMQYFQEPYPARTTVEVSALPRGVKIEIDAIMVN